MNTLTTQVFKGVEEFSIVIDGATVATAHRVHVSGIYSVKVRGQWRGALPMAEAVEYLRTLDLDAPMDRSTTRKLLGV